MPAQSIWAEPSCRAGTGVQLALPRTTRVNNEIIRSNAKIALIVLSEAATGYPVMAAAIPGKVIKANKIIHPSIFLQFLLTIRKATQLPRRKLKAFNKVSPLWKSLLAILRLSIARLARSLQNVLRRRLTTDSGLEVLSTDSFVATCGQQTALLVTRTNCRPLGPNPWSRRRQGKDTRQPSFVSPRGDALG
jgi:hypothetical protein